MLREGRWLEPERRDTTVLGFARRDRFDDSARVLQLIGLPAHVVHHYTRLARQTAKLPHELLNYAAQSPAPRRPIAAPGRRSPRKAGL